MISPKGQALDGGQPMPPLPEAIRLVLAAFAPLFTHRVWLPAQLLLLRALLAPGARTGHGRVAGHGVGHGAPIHQFPWCLDPGRLLRPPREPDSVGLARHRVGAAGSNDRPRGRRYDRTPTRTPDHDQRRLS